MQTTGALMISAPALGAAHHGKHDFLERTIEVATAFHIPHELIDADQIRRRWPQFRVSDHEQAYFEPGGGLLHPERCVGAQLSLARGLGAEIRATEPALAVEHIHGGVRVVTAEGVYEAARAVVAAGAWTASLLGGEWARVLTLYRQMLHWFTPDDPAALAPDRFPVFIWMYGAGEGDWFYGFPVVSDLGGVKVASEQFANASAAPERLDRTATRDEGLAAHARHVAGRIDGLPARWLRSQACVYTCAPQSRFIIGPDSARENVIVVSACSGHGFKHSAAIGEAVAAWALEGERPPILAPFTPAPP